MTRDDLIEVMKASVDRTRDRIFEGCSEWTIDQANEAITLDLLLALEAAGVRMVPVLPTEDQFRAGSSFRMAVETHGYRDTEGLYVAMIDASPFSPPAKDTNK